MIKKTFIALTAAAVFMGSVTNISNSMYANTAYANTAYANTAYANTAYANTNIYNTNNSNIYKDSFNNNKNIKVNISDFNDKYFIIKINNEDFFIQKDNNMSKRIKYIIATNIDETYSSDTIKYKNIYYKYDIYYDETKNINIAVYKFKNENEGVEYSIVLDSTNKDIFIKKLDRIGG